MMLQSFMYSRGAIALGFTLSKLPLQAGYRLANWIADFITMQKNMATVRSVRANQWVIHAQKSTPAELTSLVRSTIRNTARSLYEFWHFFHDREAVSNLVQFDSSFTDCIEQSQRDGHGLLIVLPHITNFDLVGRAAAYGGLKLHILSYPQPPGGYRWQNRIRERELPGFTVTPMSINALRQASETLRNGGIVATGIDRPLSDADNKYQVHFFGRMAALPVYHIRLALKNNIPISVLGGYRKPDGRYFVWSTEPIWLKPHPDLVKETVDNAETILKIVEKDILKAPDQWAMFYPVWPEVLDQVPG